MKRLSETKKKPKNDTVSKHRSASAQAHCTGYLALAGIAAVILHGQEGRLRLFRSAPARYIAEISYALYVLHQATTLGWLGSGDTKAFVYLKRPLCMLLAFSGAHLSTYFFEMRMNRIGKAIIAWRHRAWMTEARAPA